MFDLFLNIQYLVIIMNIYTILSLASLLLMSSTYGMDLVITDFEIVNFPDFDDWPAGISDPYLRFHICAGVSGGQCDWGKTYRFISQTSTINNEHNPEWHNVNTIISNVDTNYYLVVEYWDEDGGLSGNNDYVGSYWIPVSRLWNDYNNSCGSGNKQNRIDRFPGIGSLNILYLYSYYFTNCN